MASHDEAIPMQDTLVGESLFRRVMQFSLVSSIAQETVRVYEKTKHANRLLKSAFEVGEDLASGAFRASQPILATIEKIGHIEQRSVTLLDMIDRKATETVETLRALGRKPQELASSFANRVEPLVSQAEKKWCGEDEVGLNGEYGHYEHLNGNGNGNGNGHGYGGELQNGDFQNGSAPIRRIGRIGVRIAYVAKKQAVSVVQTTPVLRDVRLALALLSEQLAEYYNKTITYVNAQRDSELARRIYTVLEPAIGVAKGAAMSAYQNLLTTALGCLEFIQTETTHVKNLEFKRAYDTARSTASTVVMGVYDESAARLRSALERARNVRIDIQDGRRFPAITALWNYVTSLWVTIALQNLVQELLTRVSAVQLRLRAFTVSMPKKIE